LEQQAGLDVAIVLVLVTVVFLNFADYLVVENLANGHMGVNSYRLNCEHFQGPETAEPDVSKAGCHMHEKPQAADR
jgi:hypothetical protein